MTTEQLEILNRFNESMKNELDNNSHKGEWINWKNVEEIDGELEYHFDKLWNVIYYDGSKYHFSESPDTDKIREHIADCANLLMMLGNAFNLYDSNKRT